MSIKTLTQVSRSESEIRNIDVGIHAGNLIPEKQGFKVSETETTDEIEPLALFKSDSLCYFRNKDDKQWIGEHEQRNKLHPIRKSIVLSKPKSIEYSTSYSLAKIIMSKRNS